MILVGKRGFTLAEVLITLLIIGVVASLTIPAIMNNTKDAEYNTGIKKAYADLSSAIKIIQVNNGGSVAKVGADGGSTGHMELRNDFCSVMTCVKKDMATNIFSGITYKLYEAGNWGGTFNISIDMAAILSNGSLLYFQSYNSCTMNGLNVCGYIDIDINGTKGPNMWGKDLYEFYIARQVPTNGVYSLLPAGNNGDIQNPASTTCVVGNGLGCAAVRLSNPDNMP